MEHIPPVVSAQGARPPRGGLCFLGENSMRTFVYIHAFNPDGTWRVARDAFGPDHPPATK